VTNSKYSNNQIGWGQKKLVLILPTESNIEELSKPPEIEGNSGAKGYLALIFGILVSVGVLLYLFSDLDFEKFKNEFQKFNPWIILPLAVLFFLSIVARALRSNYLLPDEYRNDLTFRKLLEGVLVGFSATAILPMRAGEILRPMYMQKRAGIPFAAGLASMFTERIFDLVTLLTIAPILLSRVPSAPPFLVQTSNALTLISVVGIVGLLLCAFFGVFTLNLAQKVVTPILPKKFSGILLKMLAQVVQTLGAVRSVKRLAIILIYSFGIWVISGFYYQLSTVMMGEQISIFAGMLLVVTIAFAVAAPSSPGFIGTFQFGCALTLTKILGFPSEFSLAYGLAIHATQIATLLISTAIVLGMSGQNIGAVFKR